MCKNALTILFFCLIILSNLAIAQTTPIGRPSPLMVTHVGFLNELSERRRVNTFFPNAEQSIFYGQQVGHVNTSSGNTTFVRRDLGKTGRLPILIARVYDSSLVGGDDFGAGWQLSIAETINITGAGTLKYRDDTATVKTFIPATVGYKINPAQNSDIKSVMFNTQGLLQIDYLTGWAKQFKKLGDKYRLVSIGDNNKNRLDLFYVDNQLSRIVGENNRFVDIKRNDIGRIASVKDDNGRTVVYDYSQKGLLDSVEDLGGNVWQYNYHGNGLLHKVTDPEGHLGIITSMTATVG